MSDKFSWAGTVQARYDTNGWELPSGLEGWRGTWVGEVLLASVWVLAAHLGTLERYMADACLWTAKVDCGRA